MARHVCCIVPPYLLQGIATSTHEDCCNEEREAAERSLTHRHEFTTLRHERFAALSAARSSRATGSAPGSGPGSGSGTGGDHGGEAPPQAIVPPILLQNIADSEDNDPETRERAKAQVADLREATDAYKSALSGRPGAPIDQKHLGAADNKGDTSQQAPAPPTSPFSRAIHDAKNSFDMRKLPGRLVRAEGAAPVADSTVNDAYDNIGKVLDFYSKLFQWNSIDNEGQHITATVHFGSKYENAFWDPNRMQMVFGDGGKFLYKFAECLDVIGHELTHAITEHTSPLEYEGQPGALNEHISDVFGIMAKQLIEQETADKADWLIGEGCLLPDVKGVALRNMKEPGTAYNDPRFGKDPQPAHYKDYVVVEDDNGGVHLYSGIPNRAFYLASEAFGGFSYEKAGKIWWTAMTTGRVPPRCTFIQFADVTVDTAFELYGKEAAQVVRKAWNDVGVVREF